MTFVPDQLGLMSRALEEAAADPQIEAVQDDQRDAVRKRMATAVMVAVGYGERNDERLKLVALNAVDGRQIDG